MAARKRNAAQILADRAKIAGMYLRGTSQYRIAEEMRCTREMVTYDLRAIREEWRKSAIFDINTARSQELARLDEIERECWAAWEESKRPKEATSTRQRRKTGDGDEGGTTTQEAGRRVENREGNSIFMDKILECVDKRCKLLGLYAPTEMRHSGVVSTITEVFFEPAIAPGEDQRLVIVGGSATPPMLRGSDDIRPHEDDDLVGAGVLPASNGSIA
jgi:hypothetical protein